MAKNAEQRYTKKTQKLKIRMIELAVIPYNTKQNMSIQRLSAV